MTLLDELTLAWPPDEGPVSGGYVRPLLAESRPIAAASLRQGTRGLGIVVAERPGGRLLLAPLVRDGGHWRRARPRDGISAALIDALAREDALEPGFRLRRLKDIGPLRGERAIGVDQTNESVVVGTSAVVKWIAEPAPRDPAAPDLQAHLAAIGFAGVPAPIGSLEWTDGAGGVATLAFVATWLLDAADGWDWCVEDVLAHVLHVPDGCDGACDGVLLPGRLARAAAELAVALATTSSVIPGPVASATRERIEGWLASALRALDDALGTLDGEALEMLRARADALRARITTLATIDSTPVTWIHGDLHVGQVLRAPSGLSIIDLDDDVSLPLAERGRQLSPVRDVAQLASSLDHVGRIVERRTSGETAMAVDAWVDQARTAFLAGYVTALTDAGRRELFDERLLTAFEAERVCRELLYAARTLPRWMYAPLGTLRRMIPRVTDQLVTGASLVADLERKPESLARLAGALAHPGLLAAMPANPRRVVLTGMGSSRYAAEVAALRLRAAGLDAVAEVASAASGWSPGPDVLVLAISATGSSVETLAALERYRGARIVGITEAPDSPLGRAADAIVPLLAGREVSGVACRTFQHSLLVLRAIEAHLTGVPHDTADLCRRVARATRDLLDRRDEWLPRVADALDGPAGVYVLAPAERWSSAAQSALMVREGPRRPATGCETGDWSHVDVYLTRTLDYRALLLTGSRWDDQALDWMRHRRSTVVAVGGDADGAAAVVRYDGDDDPEVALATETLVAELVAARWWT